MTWIASFAAKLPQRPPVARQATIARRSGRAAECLPRALGTDTVASMRYLSFSLILLVLAGCGSATGDPNQQLVMAWVQQKSKDPSSIEVMEWGSQKLKGARAYLTDTPEKHRNRPEYWPVIDKEGTAVSLKYRSNEASGVVLNEKVFLISGGTIFAVVDEEHFRPAVGH